MSVRSTTSADQQNLGWQTKVAHYAGPSFRWGKRHKATRKSPQPRCVIVANGHKVANLQDELHAAAGLAASSDQVGMVVEEEDFANSNHGVLELHLRGHSRHLRSTCGEPHTNNQSMKASLQDAHPSHEALLISGKAQRSTAERHPRLAATKMTPTRPAARLNAPTALD